mmetsp:Transcript_20358/g.24421  ORF Transcript_20358/g.24421 Transcript_20358/m.24421 type:complete len:857 (-) Transcript_20358:303-2873(-)
MSANTVSGMFSGVTGAVSASINSVTPEVPSLAAGARALSAVSKKVISDAHFLDDAQYQEETRDIGKLLGSLNPTEKLEALKRIIACMSVGRDMSEFFPQVVVNVAQVPFEVKNLVYIYLVRYAERKPDEALLSINAFQKDLSDSNPRIRALALRVMSSIRIHVTIPIVILAIRKSAQDPSVYVRKAAAHAIPKVYQLDHSLADQLQELIEILLGDRTPVVIASAVAAFLAVCPERLDMLHRHYRKLCRMFVDVDEWGQTLLCNVLLRYARTQFAPADNKARDITDDTDYHKDQELGPYDPEEFASKGSEARTKANYKTIIARNQGFYSDEEDEPKVEVKEEPKKESKSKKSKKGSKKEAEPPARRPQFSVLSEDHMLVLKCTRPLLLSRNSGVVLGVAALHFYLAPTVELGQVAAAIVFTLRTSIPEAQQVIITNIASMVKVLPRVFLPHMPSFFVHTADSITVRTLKLEILTSLVIPQNSKPLLQELQVYLRDQDPRFVKATIRALGRCAARVPATAGACIGSLVALTTVSDKTLSAEAVIIIRTLIQQQPKEHGSIIIHMVKNLDKLTSAEARAAVIWMAGGDFGQGHEQSDKSLSSEHSSKLDRLAPEVLRKVAAHFCDEATATKLQLVNSIAKLHLRLPECSQLTLLHKYVIHLARYDSDYDVRDRARYLRMLVPPEGDDVPPSALSVHAQSVLFCRKPLPPLPALSACRAGYCLSTLSHIVTHSAPGYFALAPHPITPPPASVRDAPREEFSNFDKGSIAGRRAQGELVDKKQLEGFYNSDSEDGTESSYSRSDSESDDGSASSSGSGSSRSGSDSGSASESESGSDSGSSSDSDSGSNSGSDSESDSESD